MAANDTTPSGPGGEPRPDSDSAEAQPPAAHESEQQPVGHDPNGVLPAAAPEPDAGQNPYSQGQPAQHNPYTQGQPAQQGPSTPGASAYDQGAYGQGPTAAHNPYPQGQPPVDGYSQGAQAAAAYTQGAYTQGAYTQGAYGQGAYGQGAQSPAQGSYPQAGYGPGGYPQGATPAGFPQPAGGQRPPMDPKKKKKIILFSALAAGLVLLLIIGSVAINIVNATQYGPEATVRSYLTAISQGKASKANELVDPGVTKDAAVLLSDDVLGEATALMKNAKVTKVSTRGDSAYAEVSYSVDGTAFDDVLELSKDGTQGVFFDKWKIDRPLLASVYVYTDRGTVVSVNGKDVDFGKEYDLAAYPGTYEIGAPEGDFFQAESQTFVAGTGSKANYDAVELEFAPTEGLTAAVQDALNAHLDECATSTTDDPDDCGMYTGAKYDFTDEPKMSYSVDKYPVVTVDESGRYFSTEGGKVTATATGTLYGGGSGSESYSTGSDWDLDGSIVIDGDEVTLEDIY